MGLHVNGARFGSCGHSNGLTPKNHGKPRETPGNPGLFLVEEELLPAISTGVGFGVFPFPLLKGE